MNYRRIRAVLIKELHHITRDSRSLALALAMPVMILRKEFIASRKT